MATRTIDLLLDLDVKDEQSVKDLAKDFEYLEKQTVKIRKELATALKNGDKAAAGLSQELKQAEYLMSELNKEAQKRTLELSLKRAQERAEKLNQKFQKMAEVGGKFALLGGAIIAPLGLAVSKYLELADENDPVAARMREVGQELQGFQARLGKVVVDELLPVIEKALPTIDKVVTWLERNPDAISAALTLGGTLVAIGGALTAVGTIGSALSGIATIAAQLGIGGAGAGIAGAAGGAGLAATVTGAITAAAPYLAAALAVVIAAELTRRLVNWATGTETTWADIGNTLKQLLFITTEGWKVLPKETAKVWENNGKQFAEIMNKVASILLNGIRDFFVSLGNNIYDGFTQFGDAIQYGFSQVASLFGAERELSLSSGGTLKPLRTTNSSEKVLSGSFGSSSNSDRNSITLNDNRRFDATISPADRRSIQADALADMVRLLGAIG